SESTGGNRTATDCTLDVPAGLVAADGAINTQPILADQRQSWLRGRRTQVEDYLQWMPLLAANPEALVELIVGEFRLRNELGEAPRRDEFERRFPEHAANLREQFGLAGLGDNSCAPPNDDQTGTILTAGPH